MTLPAALRARIQAEGPIGLDTFMAAANDAYYAGGDAIGARGDFITAPEISQCFGELVGLWAAVTWQRLGSPAPFKLIELGPGRGTLMADALRAARRVPGFTPEVHLIDRSPGLIRRQRQTLGGHDVQWHGALAEAPSGPAIIIANEFLDALPIRQWEFTDRWHERRVERAGEGFRFVLAPASIEIPDYVPATSGSIFEDSPAVDAAAAEIAARVVQDGGAALLVDYGYSAPAAGDTLQAVHRHKSVDALTAPGSRDLTAHVNFTAVAAKAGPARVFGPVPQGTWLRRLGIELRAEKLAHGKPQETREAIFAGVRRLTDARAMGSLFKVMALAPPALTSLEGFDSKDAA